jgi:hypothetical protein
MKFDWAYKKFYIGGISVLISLLSFLLYLPFSFLDFDGGHDAYMTTGAIALREGIAPFTGVNLLYGIVTPYLQSLALNLSSFPTLTLRILDSVLLSAAAGISFYAVQSSAKFKGLSIRGSLLAVFIWLGTAYFFFGIPQLPWSSTFILFISVLVVFTNTKLVSISKPNQPVKWFLIAGFVAGIAPFVRINAGLSLLAFQIFFVLLIANRLKLHWRALVAFFGSLTISFLAIPLYLVSQGSFSEFFEQTVLIPRRTMYSAKIMGPEGWNTVVTTKNYFINSLPLLMFFLILSFLIKKYSWKFHASGRRYRLLIFLLVLTISGIALVLSTAQPMEQYSRLIVILYVSAFTFSTATILIFFRKTFFQLQAHSYKDWQLFSLSGISISLLTQTFPTNDPRHIWWSLLPGLFVLMSYLIDDIGLKDFKNPISLSIVALILATLVIPMGSNLKQQRTQIDFPTLALGMLVPEEERLEIKADFELLQRHLDVKDVAYFECGKGETHWYATFDQHYHSQDLWFVDTSFNPGQPVPSWKKNLRQNNIVVICGSLKDQQKRQEELRLSLVESGERLGVYVFKES